MSLPAASANSKETQHRLCVLLSNTMVRAQLLVVNQSGVVVKSDSQVQGYSSPETCVLRLDECLRELGSESESVSEVVFGLQPDWVVGNTIASSKSPLLQKLTNELSLQANGFVVVTEAIIEQELAQNPSFSGSVCVVAMESLFLLLAVQGSVIGVEQVGRSGNTAADCAEAIARLANNLEPGSRFPDHLILASLDLSDTQLQTFEQELLQVDWSQVPALARAPITKVLPSQVYANVVGSGAGRAVSAAVGLTNVSSTAKKHAESTSSALSATELGFSEVVEPVSTSSYDSPQSHVKAEKTEVPVIATSFGIPISTDKLLTKQSNSEVLEATDKHDEVQSTRNRKFTHKQGVLLGLALGVVALLGLFVIASIFLVKSHVVIVTVSKSLSQELEIELDPSLTTSDLEAKALAARPITKEVTGTDDILTTGVKIVGEQSQGTVTIFNKVEAEKTFSAGTTFKSGALEFTLDSDVTVASATAKESGGKKEITFGKTEAKLKAKKIGAEGNVSKETKFTIADFASSTYEAEADDAFAGGASREVRVVAEQDKKLLLDDLTTNLIKQAAEELESEAAEGTYVIPVRGYKVVKSDFDKELETEAERLSLTLTVAVETLSYTASDLRPIAEFVLEGSVPEGYQLTDEDPQILSSPEGIVNGEATSSAVVRLTAQVTSQAKPVFNPEELKEIIAGKDVAKVRELLGADERIKSVSIELEPKALGLLLQKVPKDKNRITVVVQ